VTEESSREQQSLAPRDGNVLERVVGVMSQPVVTLRELTERPRVPWALIVTAVIALISSLAGIGRADRGSQFGGLGGTGSEFGPSPELRRILVVGSVVLSPVLATIFLVVWAGILQGISRLLGGTGAYAGTLSGLGFAGVPYVLGIPAQVLPLVFGTVGAALSGLVQFGLLIWVLVLDVIVVRENHDFSTGRAVAAVLLPIAVVILLLVVLIVVIAVLVASNIRS
jgi:hypothetical protein